MVGVDQCSTGYDHFLTRIDSSDDPSASTTVICCLFRSHKVAAFYESVCGIRFDWHRSLPLTGWVDNHPAFRAALIITTLGNEDVASFVNGIGPWAFVNRIPQAVFPAVDFALPHKYNSATAILIA